ncbi:MAG: DUF1343 domain-containing protein [Clostridia bacterium]|nr:DUF1343 domain-containing protein [Clostridia bacterium]
MTSQHSLHVLSGADHLEDLDRIIRDRRVGLMTNPTGISHAFRPTIDSVYERWNLTALYQVEHGIRGDRQAGESVEGERDSVTGLPIYSTYGMRTWTEEMLGKIDVLIYDIQDVGARFYTFIYSLADAMRSCAAKGISVVVLDRINPLGGLQDGVRLEPSFRSFVGDFELPTRYGLTVGELARLMKEQMQFDLDLHVCPLIGWNRSCLLDDTDVPWVAPSPNCPTLQTALCYIGTCLFEGTNISEGRGTTQPFELIGAPFLDGNALSDEMNGLGLPGVHFRPVSFRPTFSKHAGESCRGVQMHLTDRGARTFGAGLLLVDAIRRQAGQQFQFLSQDGGKTFFFDLLLGTDAYREGRMSAGEMAQAAVRDAEQFQETARIYHLYR